MKEFRKDINGLRCVAVLAVLFYHFDIPGFSSGYIGVDVFFVISGYLMTDIILSRLELDKFSLIDFWLSRARRIIPALFVLLIAVMAFSWFWLPPHAYKTLARFAVASMLFISNIIFRSEAGNYFGEPAHENWLLHTWSLSVEWQFYIIYPLILIAVYRLFKTTRSIHAALLIWFLGSLAYCLYKTPLSQSSAFFFLSTRTWEFLAGAFVYIVLQRYTLEPGRQRLLEAAGLLMIAASAVLFQEHTRWPGYLAMIPVLGTACVMAAGNRQSPWSNNTLVEHIGKWSYSIYLWHWPIIVGLRFFEYQFNVLIVAAALLSSILMGGISYRWVENPIRTSRWSRTRAVTYALSAVLCVAAAGLFIMQNRGLPSRVSAEVALIDQEIEKPSIGDCKTRTAKKLRECIFGNRDNITAAVWGDSHARASITGIVKAAEQRGQGVLYYSKPGCPPILGAIFIDGDNKKECKLFNEKVFQRLQERKDLPAVLVSRYSFYMDKNNKRDGKPISFDDRMPDSPEDQSVKMHDRLVDSLCTIATGRKVFVLKPVPNMGINVPRHMLRALMSHNQLDEVYITHDDHIRQHSLVLSALEVAKDKCDVVPLDPVPYLCNNSKCYGALNNRPLYANGDHLSNYGSEVLVPLFSRIFE